MTHSYTHAFITTCISEAIPLYKMLILAYG